MLRRERERDDEADRDHADERGSGGLGAHHDPRRQQERDSERDKRDHRDEVDVLAAAQVGDEERGAHRDEQVGRRVRDAERLEHERHAERDDHKAAEHAPAPWRDGPDRRGRARVEVGGCG